MLRCEILITKVSDTKPRPWLCNRNAHVALSQKSPQNSARGDRTGAIDVLDEVPSTSRHYGEAQLTSVLVLLDGRPHRRNHRGRPAQCGEARTASCPRLSRALLEMRAIVLGTALDWLRSGATSPATDSILGQPFDEAGLRTGIEEALRELARHSPRRRHRYTLVDLANSIRPPSRGCEPTPCRSGQSWSQILDQHCCLEPSR